MTERRDGHGPPVQEAAEVAPDRNHPGQRRRQGRHRREDRTQVPRLGPAAQRTACPSHLADPARSVRRGLARARGACSGSTPGWRPRPCSSTCSAASRAASPTANCGPCSGGSSTGGPPRARPRRCSSPRSTSPAGCVPRDFTHMTELGVTIAGEPFDHLIYHFVLTYSNWETGTVCFSESFESLSEGLQNALWELGGVPRRAPHRSADAPRCSRRRRTGGVHAALPGVAGALRPAGPGDPGRARRNENGDVEQSHRRFKRALDQALMLRGSRDFASRGDVRGVPARAVRPAQRRPARSGWPRSWPLLRPLPARRLEACKRRARCGWTRAARSTSEGNVYSVPSRLIGERVEVAAVRRARRGLVRRSSGWSGCRGCGAGASTGSTTGT